MIQGTTEYNDYVAVQRAFNGLHTDGSRENCEDIQGEAALRLAKYATQYCEDDEDVRVLDAGCRTGYASARLLKSGFADACVGVDIVPEFVAYATAQGRGGTFKVADLHALPFPDKSFSWALCTQTLEHCHTPDLAVRELRRVSRLGLYIGIPLEPPTMKTTNPSHFVFNRDPMFWINMFTGMQLRWAEQIGVYFEFFLTEPGTSQ